jgi:hypothetical protein
MCKFTVSYTYKILTLVLSGPTMLATWAHAVPIFKQRAKKHTVPSGLNMRPKLKKLEKLSLFKCSGRFNLKEIKCD